MPSLHSPFAWLQPVGAISCSPCAHSRAPVSPKREFLHTVFTFSALFWWVIFFAAATQGTPLDWLWRPVGPCVPGSHGR